jgi:hypothetical protein
MGHFVTGLIGRSRMLEAFSCGHSLNRPVSLLGDLAILPLREIDLESFQGTQLDAGAEGLQHLSTRLVEELRRSSHEGPLIYFETEYFGGTGGQGAVVFRDGELVFGPNWAAIGPINHALKLIGITVEAPARDEFETVGLHRHRRTEAWLEQS